MRYAALSQPGALRPCSCARGNRARLRANTKRPVISAAFRNAWKTRTVTREAAEALEKAEMAPEDKAEEIGSLLLQYLSSSVGKENAAAQELNAEALRMKAEGRAPACARPIPAPP